MLSETDRNLEGFRVAFRDCSNHRVLPARLPGPYGFSCATNGYSLLRLKWFHVFSFVFMLTVFDTLKNNNNNHAGATCIGLTVYIYMCRVKKKV